jgi:SAM-dependent methyltransferase
MAGINRTMRTRPILAILLVATALFAAGFLAGVLSEAPEPIQTQLAAGSGAGSSAGTGIDSCPRFRPSRLAKRYLEGLHGVEIGASTQNSFDLKRAMNVDFADEPGDYWQNKACPPATVHIVASAENLPFKDNSLDYVLSSHVIEHMFDPVAALREWNRVVRPGGYIFTIAPHKDRTFDRHRDATSVQELMDRSTGRIRISDYARPLNQKALEVTGKAHLGLYYQVLPQILHRDRTLARLDPGWAFYETDDHHHWSVWRTADFVALAKRLNLKVIEVQDVDDKVGNGFTIVIRK